MVRKRGRPPLETEKVKVHFYLPEDLYTEIRDLAKGNFRSVSEQAWMMLDLALKTLKKEGKT